jgi:hypothetical protein
MIGDCQCRRQTPRLGIQEIRAARNILMIWRRELKTGCGKLFFQYFILLES